MNGKTSNKVMAIGKTFKSFMFVLPEELFYYMKDFSQKQHKQVIESSLFTHMDTLCTYSFRFRSFMIN